MEVQSTVKDDKLLKDLGSVLGSSSHSPRMSCKVGLLLVLFQGCSGHMPTLHPETPVGWPGAEGSAPAGGVGASRSCCGPGT